MHIAIVIPAYNVASYLPGTIQSVLGQTHTDWSVVVVDDGSCDSTHLVPGQFHDPRIDLIRQANAGVSAARNAGLRACLAAARRPDALMFLDGDDWLAPDALALLANALDAEPYAVAVAGRYARIGLDRVRRVAPVPPRGDLLARLLTRNLFANGGHMLIRREAIEAAGLFRVDLSFGEDWEYWTRLASLGCFTSAPSAEPLLFVRERPGSVCRTRATDPNAYRPALAAIYGNPDIAYRLGTRRLATLARRAEAELAWAVGRELIRHGNLGKGQRWLSRSIRFAPTPKRLMLVASSWLRKGPFVPYRPLGAPRKFSMPRV